MIVSISFELTLISVDIITTVLLPHSALRPSMALSLTLLHRADADICPCRAGGGHRGAGQKIGGVEVRTCMGRAVGGGVTVDAKRGEGVV